VTGEPRLAPTLSLSKGRASHPDGSRRQWIVLVCLFVLSLPAVTTRIYSSDEIQYFAYLRSMWFDRDLAFENEYRHFYDRGIAKSAGFHETFLERQTDTGRRINFATVGCAILWTPFYAVGDVVARTTGAQVDGFSKPYVAAVAYGSAVYGFLAIVLAIRTARRLGYNAFSAAIAVWLGTPLLFYMYVAPPFSHACSAFGVALFTYVWIRVREDWSVRGFVALGAAGALMAMVREQDIFFVAGPAVDFMWSRISEGRLPTVALAKVGGARRQAGGALGVIAAIVAFVAVFTPQAVTYLVLNGHLGPHASVGRKMNWMAPHALQVLFSPEHGFFVWTPLALIAIAGLFFLLRHDSVASTFRRKRQVAVCVLLMVALQIYVSGSVESWTVAGAYGQRRFIALTAALVLGLSVLQHALKAAPWLLSAAVALAVYWNLALIAEFSIGLMDRQRMEPAKNAYDAFVTLPRQAPSLIYRYLFDRSSFYRGSGIGDGGSGDRGSAGPG
jgi:hypothetical protein